MTTYTIATDPDYWGCGYIPETARTAAEQLRQELEACFPTVEFRLVSERQSWSNRANGDEELIEEIKHAEEQLLLEL